jgi:MFS family permease
LTPAAQRRVFLTVIGLIAGDTFLFTLVVPALPEFADRYSLSDTEVAILFACFPVSQLISCLAVGGPIDRWGRRPAMVGGAALLVVATAGFAAADSPAVLALARVFQGAAAALVWTAGIAAISDVYPQSELGFRLGFAETAGGILGLVGPLAGGPLIDAVGTGETFAIATVVPVLLFLATLRVPETRRSEAVLEVGIGTALRMLLSRPEARIAAAGLMCFAGVMALGESLLPLELDQRLDASATEIGLVFGLDIAFFAIAAPIAGRWSDRRGRRLPLILGGLVTASMLPLLGFGTIVFVAVVFAFAGVGLTLMAAASGPLLVAAADQAGLEGNYGVSAVLMTVTFAAGYALGPLLGGLATLVLDLGWVFAVAAVAPLLVASAAAVGLRGSAAAASPQPAAR